MDRTTASLTRRIEPGRRRGRPPSLDRERIVDEASQLADEVGIEGVTVRAVAARLGVPSMTLYSYIDSRAELLDLVVGRLLDRALVPLDSTVGLQWDEVVRVLLRHLHDVVAASPVVVDAFVRQPDHPQNLAVAAQLVAALAEGGIPAEESERVFAIATTFVVGATKIAVGLAERGSAEPFPFDGLLDELLIMIKARSEPE